LARSPVAPSPAKAAASADFVITMLATPEALEQVLFGTSGLATALSSGQILVDMSTVGPDEIRSVAARLPKGVSLVDAPVRGSVPQATSGHLDIFVGASDEDSNGFGRSWKLSGRCDTPGIRDQEPR
jgi:3-hydroxyisobutyrate dehydrogenase-like beta-hydroxyacid dehydrogenase